MFFIIIVYSNKSVLKWFVLGHWKKTEHNAIVLASVDNGFLSLSIKQRLQWVCPRQFPVLYVEK